MWFVGALVGGALGAWAGGGIGFVAGAFLGGLVGTGIGMNRGDRLAALEMRLAKVERELARVRGGDEAPPPEALEAVAPEAVAPAPQPAPQPAAPISGPAPRAPIAEEPVPEVRVSDRPAPAPAPEGAQVPGLWERMMGANLVAKVGVVILFIGIAFLLRYAYERVHVPIELRLAGASLVALVMLAVGWRLRDSRRTYALVLQGGGIGVLYLVIFGAFRLFNLLPAPVAFGMLRWRFRSHPRCWRYCRTRSRWPPSARPVVSSPRSWRRPGAATTSCCSPTTRY